MHSCRFSFLSEKSQSLYIVYPILNRLTTKQANAVAVTIAVVAANNKFIAVDEVRKLIITRR